MKFGRHAWLLGLLIISTSCTSEQSALRVQHLPSPSQSDSVNNRGVQTLWPAAPIGHPAEYLATYYQGRLYVGWEDEVAFLDLATAMWTSLPPLPGEALRERAVIVDDNIAYAVGGIAPSCRSCPHVSSGVSLDVDREPRSWNPVPPLPWGDSDELMVSKVPEGIVVVARRGSEWRSAVLTAVDDPMQRSWREVPLGLEDNSNLLNVLEVGDSAVALVRSPRGVGAVVIGDIAGGWSRPQSVDLPGARTIAAVTGARVAVLAAGTEGVRGATFDIGRKTWQDEGELPPGADVPTWGEGFGWEDKVLVPLVGNVQAWSPTDNSVTQYEAPSILQFSDLVWTGDQLLSWGGFGPSDRSLIVGTWVPDRAS